MTVNVTPDNVLDLDLFGMVEEATRRAARGELHSVLRDYRSRGSVHPGGIQQAVFGVPSIADIDAAQRRRSCSSGGI
jgi:hypothetical protein